MMRNLGVRDKILSVLVLPLLVLMGFAAAAMIDRWQTWQDMDDLGQVAAMAPIVGNMVHELQIERGLSAGFIGSKGNAIFTERLAKQRQVADTRFDELQTAFDLVAGKNIEASYRQPIDDVLTRLDQLAAKRRGVSSLELNVGQMAKYYTGTIKQLLALIEQAGSIVAEGDSRRLITAYAAVLQAKERAGLERAMGANGFGKGAFAPVIHRRFVDLIGQQSAFVGVFRAHASKGQLAFLETALTGPVTDEVNRIRKIAIDSLVSGDLGGITGPVWFDAITNKINKYHTVELYMADDLQALAADRKWQAMASFFVQTAIVVIALVGTTVIGLIICFGLVEPIRAIRVCVADLAEGRDVPVPATNRGDEIGELARSLNTVYQRGLEASRLRTALDSSQNLVMVANRRLEFVYANPASVSKFKAYEHIIKKALPEFQADKMIGVSVDAFHKDPSHFRNVIQELKTVHKERVSFGELDLELSISPINKDGLMLGAIFEWQDKTAEDRAMAQIDQVLKAAGRGDFSSRIDVKDVDGTLLTFADGINQLSTLVDTAIGDLGHMLGAVADGDLTRRLDGDYQGALGELQESANQTAERLSGIVAEIQSVSLSVSDAAGEINAGTEDLSNRTEQAASNLEETAAATEEMSSTVRRNAENAGSADDLATETNRAAEEGGEIVQDVIKAMTDIKTSTGQMTDIISVIDEIAFQTNLLALNASVEAARAGEAGKGFAVVAQEVRALAQRSATAADDIKGLIKSSNHQVQNGVELVNRAGTSLTDIVGSIGKVAGIVREISGASQEQALGIQEISSSVNQMDEMTQQNSALVEESSAAVKTLSDQASQLSELMRFFKLDPAAQDTDQRPARNKAASKIMRPASEPASVPANDGWHDF